MEPEQNSLDRAGEDFLQLAVDREDVKQLLTRVPADSSVSPGTVEYELQILKIVTVGWALSFYLEHHPLKMSLMEAYWRKVNLFSRELSESTRLLAGADIDYFEILRQRLDAYVTAMDLHPEAAEPAAVMGPAFAGFCGNRDDVFMVMIGSRMFLSTLETIRTYLEASGLPISNISE